MNWQILAVWQLFGSGWIAIIGYSSILAIYGVTLWSGFKDDTRVNNIRHYPKHHRHDFLNIMSSKKQRKGGKRQCNQNAPKHPGPFSLKTIFHATSLSQRVNK